MSDNIFDKAIISDEEWEKLKISRLSPRPNAKGSYGAASFNADRTKDLFDAQGNLLKEKHHILIDSLKEVGEEEAERQAQEARRQEAEVNRQEAEENREEAEANRQKQYINAENVRNAQYSASENARDAAYERKEAQRDAAYEQKEAQRQNKEAERQSNEEIRIENENARKETFARLESLVGDLDVALDDIIAIQESLIEGGITVNVSIPPVTENDEGKILSVEDGEYALKEVSDSSVKDYVDEYISSALEGDY